MTVSYAPGPTLPPGTPAHTRWGWVNALVPVAYLVLTAVQLPVVTLMMRDYFRQLSTIIAAQRADPYASSAMRGLMSTVMPMMLTSVALSVLSLGLGALFVVAASIHGAIALRNLAAEWLGWRGAGANAAVSLIGVVLLALGLRAVLAVAA